MIEIAHGMFARPIFNRRGRLHDVGHRLIGHAGNLTFPLLESADWRLDKTEGATRVLLSRALARLGVAMASAASE